MERNLPFVVGIFDTDKEAADPPGFLGTGILVTPRHVLTCRHLMEHCESWGCSSLYVRVGSEAASTSSQVQGAKSHPNKKVDVAVLELATPTTHEPVTLMAGITRNFEGALQSAPIRAYGYPGTEQGKSRTSRNVSLRGWGLDFRDEPKAPKTLRLAQSLGGAEAGFSGGPALVPHGNRWVCLGMLYLGGTGKLATQLYGADELIQFLTPCLAKQGVEVEQIPAGEVFRQPALPGVENFLVDYLVGTANHPTPFGGRAEALQELDAWLEDAEAPPRLLLAAPAGRGKSALLARWQARLQAREGVEVIFFPVSIRYETNLASKVFAELASQLARLHGESVAGSLNMDASSWHRTMAEYLTRALPAGQRVVLILDGVDEAADWKAGPHLFPLRLAAGVRVVVSARYLAEAGDAQAWLDRLGWQIPGRAQVTALPVLAPEGVTDVLRRMGFPLNRLGARVDIVAQLHRLSQGDPLLVRLYVDDLWAQGAATVRLQPEELDQIRPGLEGYFKKWWKDQRDLWEQQRKRPLSEKTAKTLFYLLACARGPLSQDDVLYLAGDDEVTSLDLEEALPAVSRFVIGDGRRHGYAFSHPRFAAYFYDQKLGQADRERFESRFLRWGEETLVALKAARLRPEHVATYITQHYGAHLERANSSPEAFIALVSDGWRQAWEGLEGAYGGFLNDVRRAWAAAERADRDATQVNTLAPYLGAEVRCALCVASVRSLATNIPVPLLAAVAERSPAQALAYAAQIAGEEQRAEALVALAPHLPAAKRAEAVTEALAVARAIEDAWSRAPVLTALAPHLPEAHRSEVLAEALAAAQAIADAWSRAQVLTALAPHLPEALLAEALAAARAIENAWSRTPVLTALAPHLPEAHRSEVLAEALADARAIENEEFRAPVLTALVPHLPEAHRSEVLAEALADARAIENEEFRAPVLTALVPHLPEAHRSEVLAEALADARAIENEEFRAPVLTALVPHLPEAHRSEVLAEALADARAIENEEFRAPVLTALVPHLPEAHRSEVLAEALADARAIENEEFRAPVLTALVPHLPEAHRSEVLAEALADARAIGDEGSRAKVLTALAPHLPEALLAEALAAARAIADAWSRAPVLTALAPHLPEAHRSEVLAEALADARAIENEEFRAPVLTALAPHLPEAHRSEVLAEALAAARAIGDEGSRAKVLTALAPHLPEALLAEALAAAQAIADAWSRAPVLTALAPHLPEAHRSEVLAEALADARAIEFEWSRAQVLTALAPHLPEALLAEALAAARAIENEEFRAPVLTALVPHLPEAHRSEVLAEALADARAIGDEGSRAKVLTALAPHLPEALLAEALAAARAIADAWSRAPVLTALAPHLPEAHRSEVLAEALAAARAIEDEEFRAPVLTALVPQLTKLPTSTLYSLWQETLPVRANDVRRQLLVDLEALKPVAITLGKETTLADIFHAIQDVGRWWP